MRTLITGGAGFIGTHLARKLLAQGQQVTLLDNYSPQVHRGLPGALPHDLQGRVSLVVEDVCNGPVVADLLKRHDALVHLAAETGTGQSMYEVERYERVNIAATARIFHELANDPQRTITKVVVASSRSIYGEGRYHCQQHGIVNPSARAVEDMKSGRFEPVCPNCAGPVDLRATDEDAPLQPSSFYGLTKQVQEQMTLLFAKALGISGLALRYQNVYGPGQALHNPYTGILAIFSGLARQGKTIEIFEDGAESRDFVFVEDVVNATAACLDPSIQGVDVFNVGSGVGTSVMDVAQTVNAYYGGKSQIRVSGAFRVGDIRHNIADLTKARARLGFKPTWSFGDGLKAFLDWAEANAAESDTGYERSLAEMKSKGLLHGR